MARVSVFCDVNWLWTWTEVNVVVLALSPLRTFIFHVLCLCELDCVLLCPMHSLFIPALLSAPMHNVFIPALLSAPLFLKTFSYLFVCWLIDRLVYLFDCLCVFSFCFLLFFLFFLLFFYFFLFFNSTYFLFPVWTKAPPALFLKGILPVFALH